jgi:hypothetical protein
VKVKEKNPGMAIENWSEEGRTENEDEVRERLREKVRRVLRRWKR